MSEAEVWLKILSLMAQETFVSLLTHATDDPGDSELCTVCDSYGSCGAPGHLTEPTYFTSRYCDLLLVAVYG